MMLLCQNKLFINVQYFLRCLFLEMIVSTLFKTLNNVIRLLVSKLHCFFWSSSLMVKNYPLR